MLPGLSGHLFSEVFLEQRLSESPPSAPASDERRRLLAWRGSCDALGPASALRPLLEIGALPFLRLLGFAGVSRIDTLRDTSALAATITGGAPPVTLIVTGWGDRLDPLWRLAIAESRVRQTPWCVLFNGTHARLMETQRVYSRRYVEFDIDLALDDERTLATLWMVLHASGLERASGGRETSPLHALLEASDRHAGAVSRSLKDGVLSASASVLAALLARRATPRLDGPFEQALTIVYRILFLLFAEARGLVPVWHPIYRDSYSVGAMRDAAESSRTSIGLWDALRAASRLAHAGCRAGDLRVTPFNGRLFAPSRTPLADRRDLDDESARAAVLALSTRPAPDRAGQERIAYRDLGVEQLGAVYETLLDYEPHASGPASNTTISLQSGSGRRKATGTFYTPQSIAHYLTRRTLAPLVADATPDQILRLRVLDPSMGSGAFLVAACAYLGDAYEAALIRTGACHPTDLAAADRVNIRRTVAERCLYGVDLNPMAVQLARLSLWLATLAADKPLSFLDHHLQVGDSLLGAWLSSLRTAPTGRQRRDTADSLPLFEESAVGDALRHALPVRFTLASIPNDTVEQVHDKERALAALNRRDTTLSKWKRVADLWCARWFSTEQGASASAFRALSDAILTGRSALPASTVSNALNAADRVSAAHRFFHWELEFPEAFFTADGARLPAPGFDAIIGNPPWDMIRADSGSPDSRARARTAVNGTLRFTRDAGVYSSQSCGHANRYQLFVERAVALTRAGGRIGLVLPSGLAGDQGSAPLRRLLFSQCAVDALVGFENRRQVFPIHRSVRFLLVTATRGLPTSSVACRLGETDPAILDTAGEENTDAWFPLRLTPSLLHRLSGDDMSVPDMRTALDLAIVERAAALFPPLGDEQGWGARFGRELNATEDRGHFRSAGARGLPVIEGKDIEPFRAHLAAARCTIAAGDATQLLGTRHQRARLAYRDVASATNRVTLIAAVLPSGCVSTHTLFCLKTPLPSRAQYFLCGLFNSLVVNYLVRLRVATHVTTTIVERLPIPPRGTAPGAFEEIAAIARLLARTGNTPQARRAESSPQARQASQSLQAHAFATLNARVAQLYRLTIEEFEHVLGTFPLVPREDRDAALLEFSRMTA